MLDILESCTAPQPVVKPLDVAISVSCGITHQALSYANTSSHLWLCLTAVFLSMLLLYLQPGIVHPCNLSSFTGPSRTRPQLRHRPRWTESRQQTKPRQQVLVVTTMTQRPLTQHQTERKLLMKRRLVCTARCVAVGLTMPCHPLACVSLSPTPTPERHRYGIHISYPGITALLSDPKFQFIDCTMRLFQPAGT